MAEYKLYYFDIRGWGQVIRYILEDNGVSYDDVIIPVFDDEAAKATAKKGFTFQEYDQKVKTLCSKAWKDLKPTLPFQQVPVLYGPNGLVIPQTWAIVRYLARLLGLYGTTDQDKTKIDVINERQRELEGSLLIGTFNLDKEKERQKQTVADIIENHFPGLEKLLTENNNGEEFFVGDKISFADYGVLDYLDCAMAFGPNVLETFPALAGFYKRMTARPKIAALRETEQFKSMYITFGNFTLK